MNGRKWLSSLWIATGILLMLVPVHRALAQADLSVEVVQGVRRARAGERIVYTVQVTNHGPGPAAAVSLDVTTTSQLRIIDSSCGAPPMPAHCPFSTLGPGQSRVASFEAEVRLPRGASRVATFIASVQSPIPDPERGNNSASSSTRIIGPPQ